MIAKLQNHARCITMVSPSNTAWHSGASSLSPFHLPCSLYLLFHGTELRAMRKPVMMYLRFGRLPRPATRQSYA